MSCVEGNFAGRDGLCRHLGHGGDPMSATTATMNLTLRRSLVPLLLLAAACRGTLPVDYVEEHPPGSGSWRAIAGEPTWVQALPARPGFVRAVVDSRSNLRSIAVHNVDAAAGAQLSEQVLAKLRTVIPAPAAQAAAAAVPGAMRLVERVCRDEVLTRDAVPGNTLATVWGLYEVPIADLLAHVDASDHATARAVLSQ